MKLWRPDRCAVCGKPRRHTNHQLTNPRPSWWQRLLRLAWPRWTWGEPAGKHQYQDDARRAANAEMMWKIRRRLRRTKAWLEEPTRTEDIK